jgi:deferrochelatase/peroxidase EfeB
MTPVSRRQFLQGLGTTAAGIALGGGTIATANAVGDDAPKAKNETVPFFGEHQAGIITPQQDRLCFAAFDVVTKNRDDVRSLMKAWTEASAKMCTGGSAGDPGGNTYAPPEDTGEALDLHAGRLSLTFGFGPSFFDDRFGLASKKPEALVHIPPYVGENLDPSRSDGDICVQACADDPQVAFHAVRNLARIGRGIVVMRWNQLGFGRTATTSRSQGTPRNLMGMLDGTNNVRAEDKDILNEQIWVPKNDGPDWMVGGSYLVARRIRMLIEVWDRSSLGDQEQTIGRTKLTGAPLTGKKEFDKVDLDAKDAKGQSVIAMDAHIRHAAPATNNNQHLLRRGYSFTDGMDSFGQLDAGLFFICFNRDSREGFIPIQQRLADNDALNEYIKHVASAHFAVPPGIKEGSFIAADLFS